MRIRNILSSLLFILLFTSCNHSGNQANLSDPLQAAREFIEASLKGNYSDAKNYLLPDSTNVIYFERNLSFYKTLSNEEKEGYKNANIIINPTETLSDSVIIINYSNTYKNKPSKIKMVKKDNNWMVDFKYSF